MNNALPEGSLDSQYTADSDPLSHTATGSAVVAHPDQYQTFQVIKSTFWGLGAPQGFSTTIHSVDADSTVSSEAIYHTTRQWWTKQKFFLPPDFKLATGAEAHTDSPTNPSQVVASVRYKGWEGLIGLKSEVETVARHSGLDYVHDIHSDTGTQRKISVRRNGAGREYDLTIEPSGVMLVWKGSKAVLDLVDDDAPRCSGNLKLINQADPFQPEVLAVWKNRTDLKILGSLVVFDSALEREQLLLEEILSSCLAIVLSERLTTRGWIGGFRKSGSSEGKREAQTVLSQKRDD